VECWLETGFFGLIGLSSTFNLWFYFHSIGFGTLLMWLSMGRDYPQQKLLNMNPASYLMGFCGVGIMFWTGMAVYHITGET
jgi:NO-binding membrane sensor protein with MHYT domain